MGTKMKMLPLLSVVVVLFATGAASATTTYISGSECYAQGFAISPTGTVNNDDFNRRAICPVPSWSSSADKPFAQTAITFSGENDGVTLLYYDSSPAASFNCRVNVENWDGSVSESPPLYSCSKYGGCSSENEPEFGGPGFQGGGQLNWNKSMNNLGDLAVKNGQLAVWYPTEIAINCSVPGSGSIIKRLQYYYALTGVFANPPATPLREEAFLRG